MSSLPSISEASIIVGFVSFTFTFFTFLNVFWSSLMTMKNAPREMRGYLDNLRSEIYGERVYFKKAMRQFRSRSKSYPRQHVDCAPLRLLSDSVRHLMQDFKRLEEPFLEHSADEEKDTEKSEQMSFRTNYAPMDFRHRFHWMQIKADVITLADQVNRIQSRRIAFDTNTAVTYVFSTLYVIYQPLTRLVGQYMVLREDSRIWMIGFGTLRSTF